MKACHPLALLLGLLILAAPLARAAQAQPAPTPRAAAPAAPKAKGFRRPPVPGLDADYQRMLNLVHVTLPTSFPPAAEDPKRPKNSRPGNGANYTDDAHSTIVRSAWGNWNNNDPAKANPFALPDPLLLKSGGKVATAEAWWSKRRPELVADFETEMYGRIPAQTPKVTWEVVNTSATLGGKAIRKTVLGHVDNSGYPALSVPDLEVKITLPADAQGPVPLICVVGPSFMFNFSGRGAGPMGARGPSAMQQVLDLGWGYATIATSVQADAGGDNLNQGVIGLVNKGQPRKADDWGVLMAWAWSISRAIDYFETDKQIDAKHVGLEGMSRWGKEALLAAAFEPRIGIVYCACSGEGGAKPSRRDWGETLDNVAGSGEYHWMAGNFLKYGGNWDKLPVDSHELIGLVAPRPIFVTGGTQDQWCDPIGMFQAVVAAGPVYRLLGKQDVGATAMPAPDTELISGDIGFRFHAGGHTDAPDWPAFLKFAQKYFPAKSAVK